MHRCHHWHTFDRKRTKLDANTWSNKTKPHGKTLWLFGRVGRELWEIGA